MLPNSSIINKLLYLLVVQLIPICATAQSSGMNYIQTKTFLDEDGLTFLRHIDYYDELGVVSETVDVGGNTTQTPILTRTEYTTQLKPECQRSPIPVEGLDYLKDVDVSRIGKRTYGEYLTYFESEYDDFQQLISSRKPGDAWEEHLVTMNRMAVPAGVVKKYSVDSNGELVCDGTYPYGMLMSCTTTDEDGRSMTVYTNVHENTILERRGTDNDTYYVYDTYGRLSYVLPPMCQNDSLMMSKYWYRYKYDDRGRCIEKQLPGCEPVKYWYDNANRLQSEQDGHLRSQSLYRNYRYDAIGRLLLQTVNSTRGEASESNAKAVEVKNYYDDYTACRQDLVSLFNIWADSIYAKQPSLSVARGKPTATILSTGDGKRYFELYKYDAKGRLAYKLSAYGDKWLKSVYTSYNFAGDVSSALESVYKHIDYPKYLIARRRIVNTYHPGTRLLASTTVTHTDKNGNTSSQVVSHPGYDVFGNVVANDRPGTAADMTYSYDTLHGWLKGISSPSGFSEQLLREDATFPLFSGNIGSMWWRNTSNGEQHGYDYTYDDLGRMTDARYTSFTKMISGYYDEIVSYDANGSITSLQRRGMKNDGTFGLIDDLSISYDGNRLLKVTDDAEALNYNGALDFNDGDDSDCEYQYDSNGALTKDSNRGITGITYDYGHHPTKISMMSKKMTLYNDYTPDGRKLSSRHYGMVPKGNGSYRRLNTTDLYIDGLILRDGVPFMWQFDGGYVELDDNATPTSWNYYITDHLGSTRKVVDSNNNTKETINYYPFGSEMRMQDPAQMAGDSWQPYRFTGKELDKQNGLNWYDFGARLFDVAGVPMWTSVDPLAEKYYPFTPYSYCAGDPVNKFDPDGRDWYQQTNESGATIYQYFEGSDDIEGWTNIGEKHTFTNGNISYSFEQNELVSMTEAVLNENDWRSQMANAKGVKKTGEEGNCFYQAGKMVEQSGATSLVGTANNISGYKEMQAYMDNQIDAGYSVRVQVDRKSRSRDFDGRGDHWVAISSRTIDFRTNEVLYNYYDPGTYHKEKGTQPQNRFQLRGKTWTAPAPNNLKYNLINVRRNIR